MTTATLERSDHELVAAVRCGDERAFEALYERYQRRIQGFVAGMVKDHGRAEDVTQEVFVSALRRMRETERPIAFKPWIYEIAKNACIDAFRRSRRAEEVSYDTADGLTPSDHRRLVGAEPTPDAALAAKQELETLCGAFGGLSDAHHEILIMRELEGLSYREIGERMGMSRPAVESTLFRARRRLTEEYGELVSGERCRRVQTIIAAAVDGVLGARDARRLARHVAHCQPCRREALSAGLDRSLIARQPLRRRVAAKVAAWLPFPAVLRLRRSSGAPSDDGGAVTGSTIAGHLPAISDQLSAGWTKLAAGMAVLVAGVGAGVGVQHHAASAHRAQAPGRSEAAPARAAATRHAKPAAHHAAMRLAGHDRGQASRRSSRRVAAQAPRRTARKVEAPAAATPQRSGASVPASGGATPSHPTAPRKRASSPSSPTHTHAPAVPTPTAPVTSPRNTVQNVTNPVQQTLQNAGNTVQQTTGAVGDTVQQTTGAVGDTVQQTTGTVGGAVDQTGQTVQDTVGGVTGALPGG